MITLSKARYRALRNMTRAIARGDFEAALKWSLIFDGQLMIAKRFSDLQQRRPRRKPRKPLPKPPAPPVEAPPPPPEKKWSSGSAYIDRKLREANPPGGMPLEFFHTDMWKDGRPPTRASLAPPPAQARK